jgi:hypothetical protein
MNQISSCQLVLLKGKSIFPASFTSNGILNEGPKVWLAGARPHSIKSNYVFSKDITYVFREIGELLSFGYFFGWVAC